MTREFLKQLLGLETGAVNIFALLVKASSMKSLEEDENKHSIVNRQVNNCPLPSQIESGG